MYSFYNVFTMYLFILHEGVGEKVLSAYQSFSLNQGYLMTGTFNAFFKRILSDDYALHR